MTAVAAVLPRYRDGHRLLRLLAGLAMLALACTAHLLPPATPALVTSAPMASAPAVVRTVAEPAGADVAHTAEPAAPGSPRVPAPLVLIVATAAVLLGVLAPRVPTGRAPPAV